MAKYGFYDACDVIESGEPYTLESVATVWRNFAEACRNAAAHTQGTADKVTEQYGRPYQAFGERAAPIASWLNTVATQADKVGSALSSSSQTGSSAQMEMYEQRSEVNQAWDNAEQNDALSAGRAQAAQFWMQQGATVLNSEIDKWSSAYDAFQPGQVAAAPTSTGGATSGSGGTGGGSTAAATGAALIGSSATGGGTTQQSQPVGGSTDPTIVDHSHSSVVGQDGGDFAGWVRDPRTGFLIDPSTGREFDPTSGRWVDPVTGKPFGDVVQYSTRLEGLTGGVSTSGGLLGGANAAGVAPLFGGAGGAGGAAGAGVSGLFGGMVPPSLSAGNPAADQLRARASSSMAARAYAAQQLALKESRQGGRPYLPPMQGGGYAGSAGGGARGRGRLVSEPRGTWTGRNRSGLPRLGPDAERVADRGDAAGGVRRGAGGVREEPVPGATGAAKRVARVAGGRTGGRDPYLAPTAGAGAREDKRRRTRPEWLVGDDVWSDDQPAGPAVLGEEP